MLAGWLAAFALGGASCGHDASPKCVPGQVVACPGPGACSGSQTCQASGTYGACACSAGPGTGGSGANPDGGAGSGGTGGGGGSGGGLGGGGGAGPTVTCDPVTQAPGASDQRCAWVTTGADSAGHSACLADGTIAVGGACAVTPAGIDKCRRGTACVYGTCQTLCGLNQDTCASGWSCGYYIDVPFNPDGKGTTGYCDPLCDPLAQTRSDQVTRLVLCGGKIYVDLVTAGELPNAEHVAAVRIEVRRGGNGIRHAGGTSRISICGQEATGRAKP